MIFLLRPLCVKIKSGGSRPCLEIQPSSDILHSILPCADHFNAMQRPEFGLDFFAFWYIIRAHRDTYSKGDNSNGQ